MAELIALHGADSAAHSLVAESSIDVGICVRALSQRTEAAIAIVKIIDIDHVDARDAASVPGEETISRPDWQPTHASETAETEADSNSKTSTAESEE
jgi:hypothetical protein